MFYIQQNLPRWERLTRIALGVLAGATALGWPLNGIAFWLALSTALGLLISAIVGFCPACGMVGRRPVRKDSDARGRDLG